MKASRSSMGAQSNGSASIPGGCTDPSCPLEPLYWYVDPETFYPVETHGPGVIVPPDRPFVRFQFVMRYPDVRVPAPNGGQPRTYLHPRTTPGLRSDHSAGCRGSEPDRNRPLDHEIR